MERRILQIMPATGWSLVMGASTGDGDAEFFPLVGWALQEEYEFDADVGGNVSGDREVVGLILFDNSVMTEMEVREYASPDWLVLGYDDETEPILWRDELARRRRNFAHEQDKKRGKAGPGS